VRISYDYKLNKKRQRIEITAKSKTKVGMGIYLLGFNILWNHWRCMLRPHRSSDVSLSESNIESLAKTAKVPNDEQSEVYTLQQQPESQKKQ